MRHVIDTGCDGATLCAFDPAALPDDADALLEEDPMGTMERWQNEGRFWVGGTGSDGRFVFHVHVDEALPEPSPGAQRTLEARFDAFACPGGQLWFCGAEYAARDPLAGSAGTPTGGLSHYPSQGGNIRLPPGAHEACFYRVERPEPSDTEALKTLGTTLKGARAADLLIAASMLLWILGGLAALGASLVLVVSLPIKLFQWATDNPLFHKGWHVFPVALAIAAAGLAAIAAGRWCDLRHRRSATAVQQEAARLEEADYVVLINTRGAVGGGPHFKQ